MSRNYDRLRPGSRRDPDLIESGREESWWNSPSSVLNAWISAQILAGNAILGIASVVFLLLFILCFAVGMTRFLGIVPLLAWQFGEFLLRFATNQPWPVWIVAAITFACVLSWIWAVMQIESDTDMGQPIRGRRVVDVYEARARAQRDLRTMHSRTSRRK